jgi:hypothetical protein
VKRGPTSLHHLPLPEQLHAAGGREPCRSTTYSALVRSASSPARERFPPWSSTLVGLKSKGVQIQALRLKFKSAFSSVIVKPRSNMGLLFTMSDFHSVSLLHAPPQPLGNHDFTAVRRDFSSSTLLWLILILPTCVASHKTVFGRGWSGYWEERHVKEWLIWTDASNQWCNKNHGKLETDNPSTQPAHASRILDDFVWTRTYSSHTGWSCLAVAPRGEHNCRADRETRRWF